MWHVLHDLPYVVLFPANYRVIHKNVIKNFCFESTGIKSNDEKSLRFFILFIYYIRYIFSKNWPQRLQESCS